MKVITPKRTNQFKNAIKNEFDSTVIVYKVTSTEAQQPHPAYDTKYVVTGTEEKELNCFVVDVTVSVVKSSPRFDMNLLEVGIYLDSRYVLVCLADNENAPVQGEQVKIGDEVYTTQKDIIDGRNLLKYVFVGK